MLKVKNLDVYYGGAQVLREVSIDINEGEIVTLIGSNGAGKTTLLLTLSGVKTPTSGSVEFLGRRIDKLPSHKIVNLGIAQVPQGRQLFPNMTVLENLEVGSYQTIGSRNINIQKKVQEIYSYFEVLSKRKNQRAGTLSGGEQQMLAIGRALMTSPKLLLMDEPSSGLAPIIVQNLAEIIINLRKGGLTILLVEQNAYLALELADRGYILENGSIVASGKPTELLGSELVRRAYLGI